MGLRSFFERSWQKSQLSAGRNPGARNLRAISFRWNLQREASLTTIVPSVSFSASQRIPRYAGVESIACFIQDSSMGAPLDATKARPHQRPADLQADRRPAP